MAKKAAKKTSKKTASKKSAKKTTGKAAKKSTKATTRKRYNEGLKKKVVAAIKKGMTHLEASKAFEVGVHSIPNWIKRHT